MLNIRKARAVLKLPAAMMQRSLNAQAQLLWSSSNLEDRLSKISFPTAHSEAFPHPLMLTQDLVKGNRSIVAQSNSLLDPKLPEMIAFLDRFHAQDYPHDVGSFDLHLIGTWRILSCWRQPFPITRCGLFHSIYGTDAYPIALLPFSQQDEVVSLIGEEASALVLLFCTMERRHLRQQLLQQGRIPAGGLEVSNWMTQERLHLSAQVIAAYLVVEVANIAEQTCSLFRKPGIWMSRASNLLGMIHSWIAPPPVFRSCTQRLDFRSEVNARKYYQGQKYERLMASVDANPYIAEPYIDLAMLAQQSGNHGRAITFAQAGLNCLLQWGTSWDKRRSWERMISQALKILE